MKIGMILPTAQPPIEGIGYYVWYLSKYLMEQGHQVQLITRGNLRPTWCKMVDNIPVWQVTFLPFYPYHVNVHNYFIQRLVHKLENELDLLHLHSPLVVLPKTHLPTIVTVHSPVKPLTMDIPHNNVQGLLIKLQTPFSIRLEKELFSKANRLVALSASVAKELANYDINLPPIEVIGNGVDTTRFSPGTYSEPNDPPYLFTAGRLSPEKGLEDLVQSACIVIKQKPDVRFLIAGTGPLERELKNLIKHLGLSESVILLGQVSDRSRMVDLYRKAVAYVHPSHYEGLPTVLLEAMACGKAVVAAAVSGSIDLIDDGMNGLLVPARQPEALAKALIRVIENPELSARLGSVARKMVCSKYTWQAVGERYMAEYRALLNEYQH